MSSYTPDEMSVIKNKVVSIIGLLKLVKGTEEFDLIFDKLVKIRHKKASILGFKNFIPLGYLNMNRSDYGPQEVEEYRNQIIKYIENN